MIIDQIIPVILITVLFYSQTIFDQQAEEERGRGRGRKRKQSCVSNRYILDKLWILKQKLKLNFRQLNRQWKFIWKLTYKRLVQPDVHSPFQTAWPGW